MLSCAWWVFKPTHHPTRVFFVATEPFVPLMSSLLPLNIQGKAKVSSLTTLESWFMFLQFMLFALKGNGTKKSLIATMGFWMPGYFLLDKGFECEKDTDWVWKDQGPFGFLIRHSEKNPTVTLSGEICPFLVINLMLSFFNKLVHYLDVNQP